MGAQASQCISIVTLPLTVGVFKALHLLTISCKFEGSVFWQVNLKMEDNKNTYFIEFTLVFALHYYVVIGIFNKLIENRW